MTERPARLYRIVFRSVHGPGEATFHRVGFTRCMAKASAFLALEEMLLTHPDLPRTGWYVVSQDEVTI